MTYIWEELALVDTYYVKLTINVSYLFESFGTHGLHSLPIGEGFSKIDIRMGGKCLPLNSFSLPVMSGYRVGGVASVSAELYSKAFAASNFVALHPSEELGGLPCEHGPDNQLNMALEFR
jgi:hypothetical protein